MLLTYDVLNKVPSKHIKKEYKLGDYATCDWTNFCTEVILDYIERNSDKKISGEGKTVEIDESNFGRRKHKRGRDVKGQLVF